MQAANRASPSTLEVLQWLKRKQGPISFEDIRTAERGTLLLPIYGKLTVRKLDQSRAALEAREKAIEGLIARELKRLISGTSYPKSPYELESPRFKHIQELIADFALRPYAIQEARGYKLFRIPKLDGESLAIEPCFQNLEATINVAATYLTHFFSDCGLDNEAEIPLELWLEYSFILLRYEALPGYSYLDALQLWRKEQSQKYGENALACKLFDQWKALSPFYTIKSEGKAVSPRLQETVRLHRREAGMQLVEEDTFETFLVRSSIQCLITLMNSVVQRRIPDISSERFRSYFETKFLMLLHNNRLRPYIHYFVLTVSKCYSQRDPYLHFKHLYNTLKRLLFVEKTEHGFRKKELPEDNKEAFSLLSTILLFYHTTLCSPSYLPLNSSWFQQLHTNREREALFAIDFQLNLEESMQCISISRPETTALNWIRKSIEKKAPGANVGELITIYQRRCEPFLKDETARLYALYFIQLLHKQQTGNNLRALDTFLTAHIAPYIAKDLESMLLGLMLFYYAVILAPENIRPQFDLFEFFLALDYEQKRAKINLWNSFVVTDSHDSLLDISNTNALFTHFAKTPAERAELLTTITADHWGLRPRGATLGFKATLRFIERLEQITNFKIPPKVALFALSSHAVVPEIIEVIERFATLRKEFLSHAIGKRANLPTLLVEQMGACIAEVANQTAHIQAFTNTHSLSVVWLALLPNMLSYSALPPSLSYTLSRHYHFALEEPAEKASKAHKFWHWANLYNLSVREFATDQRAWRLELSWKEQGLLLEILWINSLLTPTVRRVEAVLPFTRQHLIAHPEESKLLPHLIDIYSTDNPREIQAPLENIPPEFHAHCERLRTELRLAILLQTKPCIEYDDTRRLFQIAKCPKQELESGYQVLMDEYEGLFQDLLTKPSTPRAFTTRIFTGHAFIRYEVDYEVIRKEETILGTEEGNEHDENVNLTTITLRFSQAPHIIYTSTYETEPTPLVLALQLALLKERFYQLSSSS